MFGVLNFSCILYDDMVKKSEQDLYDLLSRLDCLEKENTQLKKLLKAKRYRFIDNIVDSLYKLTFPKKKQKNKHEIKKLGEIVKSEPTEIGRTVEKGRIDIAVIDRKSVV